MEFVYNSSHSLQWTFLKLHRNIVDILKMCMWGFTSQELEYIVIELRPFELSHFRKLFCTSGMVFE